MSEQRLQKIMAAAGVGSRRKCEELIVDGAVRVNGKVVDQLPAFADPDKDSVTVNGKRIRSEQKVYYLLNKPRHVLCTSFDPQGRRTAVDIVNAKERVYCVGRLDADTAGLILLTNDSELTNRLTHPRYGLTKTYVVRVKGKVETEQIEKLKKRLQFSEGKGAKASVKVIKRAHDQSFIEITSRQELRQMLARIGMDVKGLQRTRFGRLGLKGVSLGKFRMLTRDEVVYLKKVTARDSQ